MRAIVLLSMWRRSSLLWLFCSTGAIADVDPTTGLIKADAHDIVSANCLPCHSSDLITQNSMTRAQWLEAIRDMQSNHNLWPLNRQEVVILDYLEQNYGPKSGGERRRKNLPYYDE